MENSALACARPRPHAKAVYNERRELMLARRTIAMDDYVAELNEDKNVVAQRLKRQLGVDYVPIPVPLEPGDTEEEYERHFMEQHSRYRTYGGDTSGSGERAARFIFARRLATEYVARTRRRAVDQRTLDSQGSSCMTADVTSSTPPPTEKRELIVEASERSSSPCQKEERAQAVAGRLEPPASGDVRDTKLYVELDQYRRDYKAGVFAEYKAMTRQQKIARFGIPVVPIFVPLARGESPQQYEDRFADWLFANHKTTPSELHYSTKNRWLRMNFAMQNGKGVESFDLARLPKRKRVDADRNVLPEPSKKRVCQDEEKASVSTQVCSAKDLTSLDACTKCRCDACLLRGMKLLSEKISKMQSHAKCSCAKPITKRPQDAVVLDLTLDEDEDVEAPQTQRISPPQPPTREPLERVLKMDTDDVEEKLQGDYDRLNEQIILNQEALDASVAELASNPPVDIQEMTQLHEENEEVRALIEAEYINRTQALALLVLYQWRNDPQELKRMLRDDRVSDVVHVQQLSHRKCVVHASAVAMAKEQCASLQQQITDSRRAVDGKVSNTQQLDEEFAVARSRVQELQYQRRYECVVLVHFDRHLRQLLQELLRRIES